MGYCSLCRKHNRGSLDQTQIFGYELTGDKEAIAEAKKAGVTWAVTKTDGTSCKSSFDVKGNGVLMVTADEEVGENVLTVTCTLNANANISATTSVTVEERKINSIKIQSKDN